uniref:SH3 domain-containing protein n=1 Tax=Romanomermis culicivorax TaxID=13658 RepID=A0A915JH98_ROMCU
MFACFSKSNIPDRAAMSYDDYPQHRDTDHALRRSVFKKKSHSLDYEDELSSVAHAGNGRGVDQRGRYYPVSSRMRGVERRDREKEDYYDQFPSNYPSTNDFVDRDGHGSERRRRHLPTASSSQDYYNNGGGIYRPTARYDVRDNRSDQDYDYPPPEINYANEYPRDVYRQDEKGLSSRDGRCRYEEPCSSTGPLRNRDIRDGRYASASYEDNLYPDQYPSDRERDSTAYFGRKLPPTREEDREFRRSKAFQEKQTIGSYFWTTYTTVFPLTGRNAPREHSQQTPGLPKATGPTPGSTSGSSYHYAGGGVAPRRVIAKFDYDPKENSPNPGAEQEELTFRAGDVITIFGDVDDDGFFMGELNGRRGLGGSGGGSFEQQSLDYNTMGAAQQVQQARSRRDREAVSFANEDAVSRAVTTDYTNANGRSQPGSKAAVNAGLIGRQTSATSSSGGRNVAPGVSSMSTGKVGGGGSTGQILKKMDSTIGTKTPPKKSSGPAPGGGSSTTAQQRKQLPPVKNSAVSGGRGFSEIH